MDVQSEKAPGLRLPEPSAKEGLPFNGSYEDMPQKPEFGAVAPEARGNSLSGPAVGSIAPPSNVPMQAIPAAPPAVQPHQITATPTDDSKDDDLDKEWVNKAKMIVERTKDDPHLQSSEIGKIKADYLRIRFNKHIKVGQDRTL